VLDDLDVLIQKSVSRDEARKGVTTSSDVYLVSWRYQSRSMQICVA
jgi:hypothetical protein